MTESWRALARCKDLTASFFPEPHTPLTIRLHTIAEAKQVCARCPVSEPCLDYALTHRVKDGVWGGLTEDERNRVLGRGRHKDAARAAVGGK